MAWKRAPDRLIGRQRFHRRAPLRHHRDIADPFQPLELKKRGEYLIVGDHAAADQQHVARHRAAASCGTSDSANASSNASRLSRNASAPIVNGGQILIVAPPKPTGENMSTPFSNDRRTVSHARSASGSCDPAFTHATPA